MAARYVLVPNAEPAVVRLANQNKESEIKPIALTGPDADSISYLPRGAEEIVPSGLSSLIGQHDGGGDFWMRRTKSARTGERVDLK